MAGFAWPDFSRIAMLGPLRDSDTLAWPPALIRLQAGFGLLTALAYGAIAVAVWLVLIRRRDLPSGPASIRIASFGLITATTQSIGAIIAFWPMHRLATLLQACTALFALLTASRLWRALPQSPARRFDRPNPSRNDLPNDGVRVDTTQGQKRGRPSIATTPAALHVVDASGTLLDVSDHWLDRFGYTRQEVIGRRMRDFYVAEPGDSIEDRLDARHNGQGGPVAERRIWRGDGEIRDVEAWFQVERNSLGQVEQILVALTDVTPCKRAEAALRASEERLRQSQKIAAVGQLTGGIAHDFNNLLTTILGSLEMLSAQPGLDARSQRLARNALQGAQSAARLTSQLLSFSRRQRLSPESLFPAEVIHGIGDLLRRSAGEPIQLVLPPPNPAQWHVLADKNQLEVALVNLVLNARDAVTGDRRHDIALPREDSISIGFANYTLAASDIAALGQDQLEPGDFVGISVTDSGEGMTQDVVARAIEPFFTTKPTGAGIGLGLSQTYGFVTRSGGAVRIDSTPGLGTTVELILPRAVPAQAAPAGATGPADFAGHGETILFVEDDSLLRRTVADGLRQRGYRVIETPDGNAALSALIRGAKVDLMLTDILLQSGLNGVSVARAARGLCGDLPIMFATGTIDRHFLADWPEHLDLVQKPYSLETLALRIAARLHKPEAA